MKALYFVLLTILGLPINSQAQEVYNVALENATKIVNTPTASFTQTRIAQFKLTALVYLKKKAFDTMPTVEASFLNTQAYYLSEFLSLFFDEILKDHKAKEETRKEKIYMFMDASRNNPLFNDPDVSTTQSYITAGSELTPFSLNTDWEKAYGAALKELKRK